MIITDFRYEHIPEAEALALSCYDEERREVPALPEIHSVPALKDFPKEDRPYSPAVFWSFRIMVGMGVLMIALGICSAWLRM